ncbi:alpha/beta fold hydrolase [Epidermidibacterium keratini]|uniref:Alpha/beta fold hydrolase n=1 Tax=Epidermidibacterium keratini TaxID=1891644 RepID=A0A7L4YND9_9ACTN|nr:alpha/beta hydrolase [Epidermidibacterium keratini]QHC00067.1 alpha/beta fold hydrolase [Epidermidibacterium keratini]
MPGIDVFTDPPTRDRWLSACASDDALRAIGTGVRADFALECGAERVVLRVEDGVPALAESEPVFTLSAPSEVWAELLAATPRPPYQSFFGVLRTGEGRVDGDQLAFAQSVHVVRRILEHARSGGAPASASIETLDRSQVRGRYVNAPLQGAEIDIYIEESGSGAPLLFLHTAGADSRQYHGMLANAGLQERYRMVAFDLPGHGRSDRLPGPIGGYSLTTELYADAILGVIDQLGLQGVIVSGSSMGGEICLEIAYRAPDSVRGVIACEASERVEGRRQPWAKHPQVNESLFVPEWVYGMMAPQSPQPFKDDVWWGYSQGGFNTFHGDIDFYSGEWDGRDKVEHIDTDTCAVVMLTGEYDYSCTPAMSASTAQRIRGAVFWSMPGLGHFPMAENPAQFLPHLTKALQIVEGSTDG